MACRKISTERAGQELNSPDDRCREGDGLQIVAAIEGIVADRGKGIRKDHSPQPSAAERRRKRA